MAACSAVVNLEQEEFKSGKVDFKLLRGGKIGFGISVVCFSFFSELL